MPTFSLVNVVSRRSLESLCQRLHREFLLNTGLKILNFMLTITTGPERGLQSYDKDRVEFIDLMSVSTETVWVL
jgi:hypothetical protein